MKRRTPVYINILIVLGLLLVVFYMFSQTSDFLTSKYFLGTALISIIVVFIQTAIGDLIENEKFKKLTDGEKAAYLTEKKIPYFKYLWNGAFKSQTEKEEKDILIDHGFDGIMELDNQLPKWWLGLFYFGIAYCVLYVSAYFLTDFAHPYKEYDQEYKEQIAAVDEYMKTVMEIRGATDDKDTSKAEQKAKLLKEQIKEITNGNKAGLYAERIAFELNRSYNSIFFDSDIVLYA